MIANLVCAAMAIAQDIPHTLAQTDIVVSGQGLSAARGDKAYAVSTIGQERLDGSSAEGLDRILRDVAGLNQFRRADSRSAHPTSQGMTLRGLGGNAASRTLVMLDGVPVADPFGGWIDWPSIDPARLGEVRVTRGGGSGAFGAGALSGTVELISSASSDLPRLAGNIAYGSRQMVEAGGLASATLGIGFASLSARYGRSDGFIPIVPESRGRADGPALFEHWSVSPRATVPVGADTELQATAMLFSDRRSRGIAFTRNRSTGADASLKLVGRGGWQWEALGYVQLRRFSSQFASVDSSRNSAMIVADQYNVPASGIGAKLELRPPLGDAAELRLGTDFQRAAGRTREMFAYAGAGSARAPTRLRDAGGHTQIVGVFADASRKLAGQWTLTGGIRLDRWYILDGSIRETTLSGALTRNDLLVNRHGWNASTRIGLAYDPVHSLTLRSAAYTGYRLPTLNELYRPFRAGADATDANSQLRPERMKGIEVGAVYRPTASIHTSVTLFWNKLDNAIANVSQPMMNGYNRKRQNLEAIRSRGLEVEAGGQIGSWDYALSYALADARMKISGAALPLNGLRPAQTPKHQLSGRLGWQAQRHVRALLSTNYIAAQFEDDLNQRRLKDALMFDAAIALMLGSGATLEARAENLANTRIETAIDSAGTVERANPRTLYLSLKFRQ